MLLDAPHLVCAPKCRRASTSRSCRCPTGSTVVTLVPVGSTLTAKTERPGGRIATTVDTADGDSFVLPMYIEYDYLPAYQLAAVLSAFDDLYSSFSHADDFARSQLTFPDTLRLRMVRVETGNSVLLTLGPGIQQIVEFFSDHPVGGVAALAATGSLVLTSFSRLRKETQQAQLGHAAVRVERAKADIAEARARAAAQAADVASAVQRAAAVAGIADTWFGTGGPDQLMRLSQQVRAPLETLDIVFHSDNIVRAALGGQDLVGPKPPGLDGGNQPALST